MASVYTNNIRLEEMATGDQSGSWGDTTNSNLEAIASAFGYGVKSLAADADETLTMANVPTADTLRSMYLKINSDVSLSATRTVTLAPASVSKVWIIENTTTGGQSIDITQGSGTAVTVANGQARVIYTTGAGSGNTVFDAFQDLAIPDLFVDGDLTVGDDISLTSDAAVVTFGADGEIQLTHVADTGLLLTETGGGNPTLQIRDSNLSVGSSADGQLDIAADTELQIVAPTVDINAATTVTVDTTTLALTGNMTVSGTVDGRDISTDGTKLDGIEAGADVTDATNVAAAGAALKSGTTFTGDVLFDSGNDIRFDHSDSILRFSTGAKAIFGSFNYLEIDADGSESLIKSGIGDLVLECSDIVLRTASSETMLTAVSNGSVDIYYNNSKKFETTSTGVVISGSVTATAYNTSSDYRLKQDVSYEWDATEKLLQLQPVTYAFKADPSTTVEGFLAHELQEHSPNAVTGEKDGDTMQSVDHSKLVPLLVKTIQELEARITDLEIEL